MGGRSKTMYKRKGTSSKITKLQRKKKINVPLKIPGIIITYAYRKKNTYTHTPKLITMNTNVPEAQTQKRNLDDTAQFSVTSRERSSRCSFLALIKKEIRASAKFPLKSL